MPPARPIEPPPTGWDLLTALDRAGRDDLIAVGADLQPGTVLRAYRHGLFPMGLDGVRAMGWWSPLHRGVLEPGALHVSRSLRRSSRHFRVSVDRAFADVVAGCATTRAEGNWITGAIAAAYGRLHALGWAHSIEVWEETGRLAGGLYGVALGGLFAGESMFHTATDASKVALVGLLDVLAAGRRPHLLDVQWRTDHLASLGVSEIPRTDYLARLPGLLELPDADWPGAAGASAWVAGRPPWAPPP